MFACCFSDFPRGVPTSGYPGGRAARGVCPRASGRVAVPGVVIATSGTTPAGHPKVPPRPPSP